MAQPLPGGRLHLEAESLLHRRHIHLHPRLKFFQTVAVHQMTAVTIQPTMTLRFLQLREGEELAAAATDRLELVMAHRPHLLVVDRLEVGADHRLEVMAQLTLVVEIGFVSTPRVAILGGARASKRWTRIAPATAMALPASVTERSSVAWLTARSTAGVQWAGTCFGLLSDSKKLWIWPSTDV